MSIETTTQPFFEWFVTFGNILTIGISVATISVFIWKFAKFLRAEMKKDAEAIRDVAINRIEQVDSTVASLKQTVLDHNAFIDEKIAEIKRVTDRTNENLERIDREGTQGIKAVNVTMDFVKRDLSTLRKDLDEHVKWGQEVANWGKDTASKLEKNGIRQQSKITELARKHSHEQEEEEDEDNLSNTGNDVSNE